MIVWGLFDSGNGSYKKVAEQMDVVEMYSRVVYFVKYG